MKNIPELTRATLADLITDARASERLARALDNGANPRHYGCTADQYREYAARVMEQYRAIKNAAARDAVRIGTYGEVTPL